MNRAVYLRGMRPIADAPPSSVGRSSCRYLLQECDHHNFIHDEPTNRYVVPVHGASPVSDLIDPGSAEIFFDGIHDVKIIEGVVRIVLFSRQNGTRIVAGRLAVPDSELPDVVIALAAAAKTIVRPPQP